MDDTVERTRIEPELIERSCGGWLAATPQHESLRLATVGDDPDEAVAEFNSVLDMVNRSLDEPSTEPGPLTDEIVSHVIGMIVDYLDEIGLEPDVTARGIGRKVGVVITAEHPTL